MAFHNLITLVWKIIKIILFSFQILVHRYFQILLLYFFKKYKYLLFSLCLFMARELTMTFYGQLVIFTWFRRIILNYDAISNKGDMFRWNKGFPGFLESRKALEVARLHIIVPEFKQLYKFLKLWGHLSYYIKIINSRRYLLITNV